MPLLIINLEHPNCNQINLYLSTNSIPKLSSPSNGPTVGKMQKMTKGHNSVKNMTNKNPERHAHLQVIEKRSAKLQINLIEDVAGVAGCQQGP